MTEFKQLLICVDKNYTNFRLFDVSCVLPVLGSSCAQCLCLRLMQDFFVKNWFLLEGNRTKRQGIEIYLHGGKRSDTACLVYGSPHLYLVGPCIGGEGATSWCKRGNIFGAATYTGTPQKWIFSSRLNRLLLRGFPLFHYLIKCSFNYRRQTELWPWLTEFGLPKWQG